jgi:acyl-CoA reductase-like NAD-dependent aldehyde dehydrogenase
MSATLITSVSPQRPDDVVADEPAMAAGDVAKAADRARDAQREWTATPAPARAQALHAAAEAVAEHADELTALMVREVGKPVGEARGESARAVAILRYYAQQVLDPDGETYPGSDGRSLLMSRRRPHGVAGLITPWNFPAAIPLWKGAPALAFGNAVLLKPAPEATGVARLLERLIAPVLPDHLLTVLPGEVEAGQAVVESADVVSLTGSVGAGEAVRMAAASRGIPAQCEMGGQNASLVLADADLEHAATTIASAAMGYAGQKCTATSRVIVVGDADAFAEAFAGAVDALVVGDPDDPAVSVGPVIDENARDAVVQAAERVRSDGGQVVRGGRALDRAGFFVEPTVVTGIPAGHPVAQEEVFGPICAVLPASTVEDAVALANGTAYGLAAAVFTRDLTAALAVSEQLDAGLVRVNGATSGVDFYAPFGGEKASSYGPREQGKAAREFYTRTRTITVSAGA